MVLFHTRQKYVQVLESESDKKILKIKAYLDSHCIELSVEMSVRTPQMIIESVECKLIRYSTEKCFNLISTDLKKIEGLRIGPGITKIVNKTLGKSKYCPFVVNLVMECCEASILSLTAGPLYDAVPHMRKMKNVTQKDLIRFMPNLKNTCIAFLEQE